MWAGTEALNSRKNMINRGAEWRGSWLLRSACRTWETFLWLKGQQLSHDSKCSAAATQPSAGRWTLIGCCCLYSQSTYTSRDTTFCVFQLLLSEILFLFQISTGNYQQNILPSFRISCFKLWFVSLRSSVSISTMSILLPHNPDVLVILCFYQMIYNLNLWNKKLPVVIIGLLWLTDVAVDTRSAHHANDSNLQLT